MADPGTFDDQRYRAFGEEVPQKQPRVNESTDVTRARKALDEALRQEEEDEELLSRVRPIITTSADGLKLDPQTQQKRWERLYAIIHNLLHSDDDE
jgi:hypothetical protein